MVGVLNELAVRDLVERAPDPGDGRRNIITISTRGRRHLRLLDKVLDDLHDELLAPLSPAERDQFVGSSQSRVWSPSRCSARR
jgi:MarR family transcriptional regulator, lower aerobic nicotinate degradation pathway regulator